MDTILVSNCILMLVHTLLYLSIYFYPFCTRLDPEKASHAFLGDNTQREQWSSLSPN